MNKYVKFAGIATALTATLLLGGCNEEKKYNALKAEIISVQEEIQKNKNISADFEKGVTKNKEVLKVFLPYKEKVDKNLAEMEKLSKDNTALFNDYLKTKSGIKAYMDTVEYQINHAIEIAEYYHKK